MRVISGLLILLVLPACVAPQAGESDLFIGSWVQARGVPDTGTGRVTKILQPVRKGSDSYQKVEIIAPLQQRVGDLTIKVLGSDVRLGENTIYENLAHERVPALGFEPGNWLRIKARNRASGGLRSREIHRIEDRKEFRVEGEVRSYDAESGRLQIGSLLLQADEGVKIQTPVEEGDQTSSDPLAVFTEDDQKSVAFSFHPLEHLFIGGQVALKGEFDDEFDLDKSKDRDQDKFSEDAKLDFLWTLDDDRSFVLLEGKYLRVDRLRDNRPNLGNDDGSLSRAYAYLYFSDALRLQIGRQDFDEEREWLYDEILDGLRLRSRWLDWELELSASTGREFLQEHNSSDDTSMLAALLRYRWMKDQQLTAYVLRRTDAGRDNFEPMLYGLRSFSKPYKGLGHWLELAVASGDSGSKSIHGSAFDGGLLYRFDLPWRPSIVAGYAFGSGKSDSSSDVGFRQSGLQDNNARYGGVTSFKYYGEVLEPELANLEVTTLGLGIVPEHSFSLDMLWHGYRMDVAKFDLVNSSLRTKANGASRDVGWELDMIAGYRYGKQMNAELIAGHFVPGRAFDNRDTANKIEFQVRFKF